jgi:hypothetical protein
MMAACRAIVASDLSDEAKEAPCFSVLQDDVGRIALSRYGCCDVQQRFDTDSSRVSICRAHSQWREAYQPSDPEANQLQPCHQLEDC